MKICPECGDVYPAQATVCRAHGIPLREWADSTEVFAAPHTDVEESRPGNAMPPTVGETDEHTTPELEPGGALPVSPTGITPPVQVSPEALLRTGPPRGGRTLAERYRLERQIGIGGYGAVFDAYDTRLRKRVAVKVLSPALSQSPEEIERFRREAVAASQVRHEGIVDVTDLDRDADGTFFIVMEYLGGVDLGDVLDAYESLEPPRALEIAEQCANALAAAHEVGIVHRDLKPANIFLTTTRSRADIVKIIDFGISKVIHQTGEGADLTSASKTVGTPAFMSPEQARTGGKIDVRTDVYALGVILFVMLTGELPFKGDSALEILTNHLTQRRVPPSAVNQALKEHPALDELVLRAIAIEPSDRYRSMEEFGQAIRACAAALRGAPALGPEKKRGAMDERTAAVSPLPSPGASALGKASAANASSGEVTLVHRAAPRRLRPFAIAAVAIAAVALAVGIWIGQRGDSNGAAGKASAIERGRDVAPAPAAESPPETKEEPAVSSGLETASETAVETEPTVATKASKEFAPARESNEKAEAAAPPRKLPSERKEAASPRKPRARDSKRGAAKRSAETTSELRTKPKSEGTIAVEEW